MLLPFILSTPCPRLSLCSGIITPPLLLGLHYPGGLIKLQQLDAAGRFTVRQCLDPSEPGQGLFQGSSQSSGLRCVCVSSDGSVLLCWSDSGLCRNSLSGCLVRSADSTRRWNVVFLEEATPSGRRFDSLQRVLCRSAALICVCVCPGYGQTGPQSQSPGYDSIACAASGMMHITGPEVRLCCVLFGVLTPFILHSAHDSRQ